MINIIDRIINFSVCQGTSKYVTTKIISVTNIIQNSSDIFCH